MLFRGRLLRERPGQHEFGLENGPAARHHPIKGRPHPPEYWMHEPMLNAFYGLLGIALVPMPIEGLSRYAELDDEVAGEVVRLGLAPFLAPEADKSGFIGAHDDPGVGSADEEAPIHGIGYYFVAHVHRSVACVKTTEIVMEC